jgi:arylsulfatase A-like enzyme
VGAGVGFGAGGALVASALLGARAGWAQRYLAAGHTRLFLDEIWQRFDVWVGPAVAAALAAVALGWWFRRGSTAAQAKVAGGWADRARRLGLMVAGLVLLLRGMAAVDRQRLADGPNVVLVSIDTLRADRLGGYGHVRPTSPTIDHRLAAAGVVFERCLSQSPKTTPSHMTMLTSLYPCVHGVSLWEGTGPGPVLNPAVHTLAEVLKNAGYATGAFTGRGHVHRSRGFGQGFDVYRHRRPYGREVQGRPRELEEALAWMSRNRARKFFLFFHTYAVHDPYLPPREHLDAFDDGDYQGGLRQVIRELRDGVRDWEEAHQAFWDAVDTTDPGAVRFLEQLYDGAIRHADATIVGALLDRIDELSLAAETLVVLTSDHGEAFGEHGRFLHGDLHVETLHVPLILRFPGRLPAATRVRTPVRLLDLMPTILELVDLPAPPGIQGRSLVPLIAASEPTRQEEVVTSEFNDGRTDGRFESIRRGGLTYIVDGQREQLFDHERDPQERRDLARERVMELEGLRKQLASWQAECRRLGRELGPGTETVAPDARTLEQLRALGYVE